MEDTGTFGQWLKRRRKALDLTQADLAEAVGYSISTIRKVEADEERPSKALVDRFADVLRIPETERLAFTRFARDLGAETGTVAALPLPPVPAIAPATLALVTPHSNLPTPPTPLIGRETELATLLRLLRDPHIRLLTLTGPGGTGKTRLALQVSADSAADFADGVFFVNLAPLADSARVIHAIAQALDVHEDEEHPLVDLLHDYLREKRLLLVLDNFEHLVSAAPEVASLLSAAPALKILVTSREVLRLRGEHDFAVPPLAVPPTTDRGAVEDVRRPVSNGASPITQYEAVQLFIQRAREAKADFAVTDANAPAVAEICYRLDGLPLAIELAAARVRLLPPEAILPRLGSRLKMLTGGARDLPPRQQTLRNAIAWSYDLLDSDEKALFRRLAVLAGPFALEAAEALCPENASSFDVLDGMGLLVQKSLLRQDVAVDGEPRYAMLDTIREYALEQLAESGEETDVRRAHARYFLALAERARTEIRGPLQVGWYRRLEGESINLLAALAWARDTGDAEILGRLAAALFPFWFRRGSRGEGVEWLEAAAARSDGLPSPLRAALFHGLGVLRDARGDGSGAQEALEQSLALWPEDDPGGRARVVNGLASLRYSAGERDDAVAMCQQSLAIAEACVDLAVAADCHHMLGRDAVFRGDYAAARAEFMASVAGRRAVGDVWALTWSLDQLGELAEREGDYESSAAFFRETLAMRRELGLTQAIAASLNELGEVARCRGDFAEAEALYEEALARYRHIGAKTSAAVALLNLGYVALHHGDVDRAAVLYRESLTICRTDDFKFGCGAALPGVARVWLARGEAARAARVLGATEACLKGSPRTLDPADRMEYDRAMADARAALGDAAFTAAYTEGQTAPLDETLADALAGPVASP
ncbi:MAG: tetratricopeptide repeat protein [Anaerolineae bacterium]